MFTGKRSGFKFLNHAIYIWYPPKYKFDCNLLEVELSQRAKLRQVHERLLDFDRQTRGASPVCG